jgi:hypothetical protein
MNNNKKSFLKRKTKQKKRNIIKNQRSQWQGGG